MSTIIQVPVDQLDPHPHNPRRDLGDLTDLTKSIKVQGIRQNLLVTLAGEEVVQDEAGLGVRHRNRYTVVIGHRRLAAAKLAHQLPQWEKDLLATRQPSTSDAGPHTCLKPRPREPYVCLHVRIVRPDEHGPWVLTCQEPGCSHLATGPIAADLADLGRIHTASHGGRS